MDPGLQDTGQWHEWLVDPLQFGESSLPSSERPQGRKRPYVPNCGISLIHLWIGIPDQRREGLISDHGCLTRLAAMLAELAEIAELQNRKLPTWAKEDFMVDVVQPMGEWCATFYDPSPSEFANEIAIRTRRKISVCAQAALSKK